MDDKKKLQISYLSTHEIFHDIYKKLRCCNTNAGSTPVHDIYKKGGGGGGGFCNTIVESTPVHDIYLNII